MGMFDNDILYGGTRLTEALKVGTVEEGINGAEKVVLIDAIKLSRPISTEIGLAWKTSMLVAKLEDGVPGDPFEVNTLSSAIAGKVDQKSEGDLPAIVAFFITKASQAAHNDATVMQFVAPYDGPDLTFEPLKDPFHGETVPDTDAPVVTKVQKDKARAAKDFGEDMPS